MPNNIPSANICVIIPVYNDVGYLRRLLAALAQHDVQEIIVVDGGSNDDSKISTKRHNQVTLLESAKGRGQQIAHGIASTQAEYIWVLHADSCVAETAAQDIRNILAQNDVALGCFSVKFDVSHPLLALFSWLSRFDSPITTFGDQGFFFRRKDLLAAGGMNTQPLLEDVALRFTLLRHKRGKVSKSNLPLITSSRKFLQHGMFRTQVKNAWTLLRYFCGVDTQKLYNEYYGA